MTLAGIDHLVALDKTDDTFQMNEEAFRAFYDLTSRPVWLYLSRITGDQRLADDLLQEAYYRLLRGSASFESDEHRRNYLYRIATNLVRDHHRASRPMVNIDAAASASALSSDADVAQRSAERLDLSRAMQQLKPRERSLLWLAYGQGCSHEEIAATLGLKTSSLKMLLFRARRRLAGLLRQSTPPGDRS